MVWVPENLKKQFNFVKVVILGPSEKLRAGENLSFLFTPLGLRFVFSLIKLSLNFHLDCGVNSTILFHLLASTLTFLDMKTPGN